MKKGRYYCAHLHMHSCFGATASMEGHMYEAQRIGVEIIWFTDHDSRIGKKKEPVDEFDFEKEALLVACGSREEVEEKIEKIRAMVHSMGIFPDDMRWEQSRERMAKSLEAFCGWRRMELKNPGISEIALTRDRAFTGTQCVKFNVSCKSGCPDWQGAGLEFSSSGGRHRYSLLALVKLKIANFIERDPGKDGRIIFEVQMSQRPPEHKASGLRYVIGDTAGLEEKYTGVIPVKPEMGRWQEQLFNLSEDAARFRLGGQDNVFDTLRIIVEARNGASVTCCFDDFKIITRLHGEPARKKQQELAAAIGKKYGVIALAGTEISLAGPHKNCFSTSVPVIDYAGRNYHVTQAEAIQWVLDYGGIFSLNHPFDFWKQIVMTEEEKRQVVKKVLEQYSASKCYGASLIEVGFPQGRHGFDLDHYLALWDGLSEKGIFITGYGDSDNHANHSGWWNGNNFAAWIYAAEPTEEKLVNAMKSGNLYTGDPASFRGKLLFETSEGGRMGQVIKGNRPQCRVIFEITCIKPGWTVQWVVDGVRRKAVKTTGDGYRDEITVELRREVSFVRVEVYAAEGRCVILTNPIYFVRGDRVEIPEEREAGV